MSIHPIQTEALAKRFAGKTAVDSLSISIPQASVCGFLGVNGAGKTTVIRMIMGHLHPSSGKVQALGSDPRTHDEPTRSRISYVSENMNLPGYMTPEKAIRFNRGIYRNWDSQLAATLLDEFDLAGAGAFSSLSKGQKRKLCILVAVCQKAELLIMDEPAAGLDVMARRSFLQRVLDIACCEGTTVFISSHLLSDLERIVDSLIIIDGGRAVLTGQLEQLKAGVKRIHFPAAVDKTVLSHGFDILKYEQPSPAETLITVSNFTEQAMQSLAANNTELQSARVFPMNLEDMFVELVDAAKLENTLGSEQ